MPVGLFSIFVKNGEMLVKVPQMQRRRDTKCGILHVFWVIVARTLFLIFQRFFPGVEYDTFSFSLQLLKHYEKDCPLTITSCPYAQMGCVTKVSCFLAKFRVTSFILKVSFIVLVFVDFSLFLFLLFKKKLTILFHLHKPVHNGAFYRCGLSVLAFEWTRGWDWPCCDKTLLPFY